MSNRGQIIEGMWRKEQSKSMKTDAQEKPRGDGLTG